MMLTGLKDMLPGQAKPPPPSATTAQVNQPGAAPEQQEQQSPAEQDVTPPVADGAEPMDEAEVEKMLFDEYLGATEYTFEEFLEAVRQPPEEKGETEEEKQHWTHPRRWKVVLWNLTITNFMSDQLSVFVEIEFGGSREECKVQKGDRTCIYAKGEDKNYLRTSVVNNVTSRGPVDMQFRKAFEYRGSYLDLEKEKLKIKVWEYRTWTLNHLEAVFEEPLLTFATGETHIERDLYKKSVTTRTQTRARGRNWQFVEQAKYRLQQRNFRKTLKKGTSSASRLHSRAPTKFSGAASGETAGTGRLRSAHSNGAGLLVAAKSVASVRAPTALSKASRHLMRSESTRAPSEFVAQTPYHDVLISHIQTLLLADQDDDEEAQAEFDLGEDGGAASPETPKELPTVRLRISLMHSSSMNSGVRIVSSEQENTSAPSWDNLGEVYFRGTLRDLDATYLEVIVEDMSASSAFRQIGYAQLPLRGVVGYPSLQMELGSPNWVSLQAKVEGWGELLNDWHFGWLEGRVMIAHTPRYRQLGEVCEVDPNRVYLIVKILSVDQIITADNRSSVDAYVEVSFDGTSRRTRIIRSSLNPVWDDEVTIPLRFASMRDISYSEIQKKGKSSLSMYPARREDPYVCSLLVSYLRLPQPERFDTKHNMPRGLADRYDRLKAAIFHYVRCVPFVIKRQSLTFSPDFTMQLSAGDPLDHCLLMASLLLGLPTYAFVCIGTLHDKHTHAWVATFHWDEDKDCGHVKFWETSSGVVYVLKNRFVDNRFAKKLITDPDLASNSIVRSQRRYRAILVNPDLSEEQPSGSDEGLTAPAKAQKEPPIGGPKLPYRSLDIMFNHTNVWLNIQDPNPSRIWFDIWNFNHWYQFCPGSYLLTPCFIPKGLGTKISELQFEKVSNELVDKVMADLTAFRASRNLNTKWNRDEVLEAFLQTLHVSFDLRVTTAGWSFSIRVRGAPLHYNTMDPKSLSDSIIRQVEFLESRDRSAAFAMAASMYNLPGELCSTYIYLLLCQKVTERERRRILAAKEQEGRELGQRRARAKRMNYNKKRQQSGKNKADDQEEGAEKEQELPVGDRTAPPPEGPGAEDPEDEGAALATLEIPEDAAPVKKKKKKKAKIPKVKKRAPNLSPESEVAYFEIGRDYYEEDEAPDFKTLMQELEDSIAEVLHVSPMRIRGFQGRYYEKRLVFAIQPDPSAEGISDEQARDEQEGSGHEDGDDDKPHQKAGALSPAFLMEALKQLVGKMLSENDVFAEITGEQATLIWEGPGSRPYCKEEKGEPSDEGIVVAAHLEDGGSETMGHLTEEELSKKKKKKKKVKKRSTETEEAPPVSEEAPPVTDGAGEAPSFQPFKVASASLAPAAAAAGATLAVAAAAGEAVRQKKEKKAKKKVAKPAAAPEPPPTPPTKDTAPSPASPVTQPTSSPPSSSSSSSSDEEPPPLPSPPKTNGLRVAAAGAVARAVARLKSHKQATSTGSSGSSSETDSQMQAAERQIRQRLEDLTKLRQQLQQKQDTETETDSLSLALSSDPRALSSNAEVRYLSEDDLDEESDWEEEEAATRELKEKIERLTQRKLELEALKATLAETKDTMKFSQLAIHASEWNKEDRSDSSFCSNVSVGPYLPSPPPLSLGSCVSRHPQLPAIARADLVADRDAAASLPEPLYPVEHLHSARLPAHQAQPQLRFLPLGSTTKHERRRRPSLSSGLNSEELLRLPERLVGEGLQRGGKRIENACTIGKGPPTDAADSREESTGRVVSREVSEPLGSGSLSTPVADAAAVMLRQQKVLRQRLQEAQRLKQQQQRQQRREHAASGYTGRPSDYAYQRIKQRKAHGTGETQDLLRGFFSPSSSSGESEY
ncbi:hypothetical protein ACSSS7_001609 [Eimeria intestinalis]